MAPPDLLLLAEGERLLLRRGPEERVFVARRLERKPATVTRAAHPAMGGADAGMRASGIGDSPAPPVETESER